MPYKDKEKARSKNAEWLRKKYAESAEFRYAASMRKKKWRADNVERARAQSRKSYAAWAKRHPERVIERQRLRKAANALRSGRVIDESTASKSRAVAKKLLARAAKLATIALDDAKYKITRIGFQEKR